MQASKKIRSAHNKGASAAGVAETAAGNSGGRAFGAPGFDLAGYS